MVLTGMWKLSSPLAGVDGRTMYDRDFLMFFKNMPVCLEKPDEMHTLISVDIYHTGPVNYPPPMGGSIRDRDRDYFGGGKNERRVRVVILRGYDMNIFVHIGWWWQQKRLSTKDNQPPAYS